MSKDLTEIIANRVQSGTLNPIDSVSLREAYLPLADVIATRAANHPRPFVFAIVGRPGSGKTTLRDYLTCILGQKHRLHVAGLGLDDLYLDQQTRAQLAREHHPLFRTRGTPGTHDLSLGLQTTRALINAAVTSEVALPRFDKKTDNPLPRSQWPLFKGRPDIILIDSWLWQVQIPEDSELEKPLNERERADDPDGALRRAGSRFLSQGYQEFFDLADEWVRFEPPSWQATVRFREEQERCTWSHLSDEEFARRRSTQPPVAYFLELFQRWSTLPNSQSPTYRIQLNELHRASLVF